MGESWWRSGPRRGSETQRIQDRWTAISLRVLNLSLVGGSVGKNPLANAGDAGFISEKGGAPGVGNGNPLQYSCLENPMDRGARRATVLGVVKSPTQFSDWTGIHTEARGIPPLASRGDCDPERLSHPEAVRRALPGLALLCAPGVPAGGLSPGQSSHENR